MKKSDINQPPCYFDKYIDCVEDGELLQAFDESIKELETLELATFNAIGDKVYATGKWTIKEIFQHLIDCEHILAYRALRIGRNDKTKLQGFDQDVLAANVSVQNRNLQSLIEEMKLRRKVTKLMFETFTDEHLQIIGYSSDMQMTALAFGFTIIGHQKYHLNIIAERYFSLA
ncbi:MAG: DinB family protein [Pyrinomonadaceae bacterium]|jgi:hypothetical protein|nr:DinB family protein [Pyrinomonadaceae bacterium]